MYSEAMTEAVKDAQTVLNACCSAGNISIVATDDLTNLNELLKSLDPTKIDFSNTGFFNKSKINNYWNRFFDDYNELESLTKKLTKDAKILKNTLKTLNVTCNAYETEFTRFLNIGADTDIEYMQQKIVSTNMSDMLKNTLLEYETLEKKVSTVLNVLIQTLDIAILLAKTKYKRNVNYTASRRIMMSNCTENEYQASMKEMISCLR